MIKNVKITPVLERLRNVGNRRGVRIARVRPGESYIHERGAKQMDGRLTEPDHAETNPASNDVTMTMHAIIEELIERLTGLHAIINRLEDDYRLVARIRPSPASESASKGHVSRGQIVPQARMTTKLTERENQVLALLLRGFSNRQIARTLEISELTVKNHLHAVFLKLDVTDRTQAIARVLGGPDAGYTAPPDNAPSQQNST